MNKIGLLLIIALFVKCADSEQRKKDDAKKIEAAKKFADSITNKLDADLLEVIGEASFEDSKTIYFKTSKSEISKLKEKKDDFKGSSFYEHKKTPTGWNSDVRLYIVKSNEYNEYFYRLRISYKSDDWLFMNEAIFLCDGKKYILSLTDADRDNDGGEIYEYWDKPVNNYSKKIIEAIVNAKEVKMRYNGDQYYSERILKSSELNRIKEVYSCL